jgi:hypothetical protein
VSLIHYYTFEADAAKAYTVLINEGGGSGFGDGTKTAGVYAYIRKADSAVLVNTVAGEKYALPSPLSFTGYTGRVYVSVSLNDVAGTYGVCYQEYNPGNYPPAAAPQDVRAGSPPWGASTAPLIIWKPAPGAEGYRLYRSTNYNTGYAQVGGDITGGAIRSAADTSASVSTSYYYKVSAYNSQGEGPQSDYSYIYTLSAAPGGGAPGTAAALNAGEWKDNTIAAGTDRHWYSFSAEAGKTYRIQANDSYNGNNTKTAAVYLSVYDAAGSPLEIDRTQTYTSYPLTISGASGTVYIQARPYGSGANAAGTYSVRYFAE